MKLVNAQDVMEQHYNDCVDLGQIECFTSYTNVFTYGTDEGKVYVRICPKTQSMEYRRCYWSKKIADDALIEDMYTSTNVLLMLTQIFINCQHNRARLFSRKNYATAELLHAIEVHKDYLKQFGQDYDEFCNALAEVGGFERPHNVGRISADWFLPFEFLFNGLEKFIKLHSALSLLGEGSTLQLPLSTQELCTKLQQ